MLAYHYTTFGGAVGIIQDGVIKLTRNSEKWDNLEAVWFSLDDEFDTGCGMYIRNDAGEFLLNQHVMADTLGLCRFGVAAESTLSMPAAVMTGRMTYTTMQRFRAAAKLAGADGNDWRVAFSPWPTSRICAVEAYVDGEWRPMTSERMRSMHERREAWLHRGGPLPTLDDPTRIAQSCAASP